ncbi:MAG TPA: hypothetical protein PLP14_06065, partial [Chitinophagaceae bacterium]|nr:hypothetical protein [Chitinophagaceae bacterium]
IAWLNQDYGFQPRYGNAMNSGSGLAPDLGAWEMNGTGTPLCSGTPSMADAQVSNYNPCTDSAFTLYLTQVYGPGTQYQWYNSSDSASGYTAIAGATQSVYIVSNHSDTWYRCNVTCSNGNQTIQSTPVKSDISMMNGTYTIDNTGAGNFISFAAAIQALHCRGTSGPVVFSIPAGQVFAESVNLIINYNSMYPVTFQKTGLGANPKITRTGNSNTTNYILQLKGADHIVFDGIDFEQGSTLTTQWVEFGVEITNASATDGAQYNVIKNGTISLSASNTNAIGIYLHSDATPATQFSGTNSYNRFLNMVIQNAFTGYKLNGYSMIVQDEGNEINTESGGFSVINTLGDRTTTGFIYGITATQQANFRVENTEIYSILPGGTSSAYGIYYYYADSTTIYINNNHIHDIEGVGNAVGINLVPQCNIVAQNNKIEAIASTSTSAYVKGINLTVSDTAKADGNRIFNLSSTGNTTTSIVTGMDVTMNSGLCQVSNNMISDLRSPNCTTTSSGVAGIALNSNSTAGQLQVYYNSVLLSDVGLNASYTSSCFDINSSASTIDMRNNIWINRSDVTTGTRAMAINKSNTTDNIDTASNNNVLYAGVADSKHALLYDFTNICITPATYKALSYITPAEQFTAAENVNFQTIGGGILRPSYTTPTICANRAKICNTMDHDFENELRSSTPDIGADEGVFVALNPACVNYVYPTNGQSGICPYENISLQWSLPSLGNTVALGYSVYFGTNPNPPYIGLTSGFSYPVSSLQPNTVYYWKVVARYNANDSAFCFIQSFTTTAAMVQSTQSAARCGTGVVNLSVNGTGPFNWYTTASGGTPVQTGNTYTPTVSATTTYYVAAADGYRMPQTCGASGTGIGTTSQVSTTTDYLTFNAISKFILDSVVVYPNASGSLIIQLKNSAGTTLLTKTISVGSTQINLPLNVSLGWVIDPGTA